MTARHTMMGTINYAPQAEFVMFERSGHDPFIEEPDKTFKVIKDFLGK